MSCSASFGFRLLAPLVALSVGSAPAWGQTAAGAAPLAFDLRDQFGARWHTDSLRGRALVLVAGTRAHADDMKEWSDSLQRVLATDTTEVRWVMVADLRSVPRFMQRMASQRAPREAHRALLLDADGTVARQLRLDRNAFTVVVLDRAHQIRLRMTGVRPTAEQLRTVRGVAVPK